MPPKPWWRHELVILPLAMLFIALVIIVIAILARGGSSAY
jgi:hypothetical protein